MLAIAPGTSKGARLLTIPAPVSRSASFHAHAAAYGPPPEIPNVTREREERLGDGPDLHPLMGHPERRALLTADLDVVLDDHVGPSSATVG
jgi:hypothetical protein